MPDNPNEDKIVEKAGGEADPARVPDGRDPDPGEKAEPAPVAAVEATPAPAESPDAGARVAPDEAPAPPVLSDAEVERRMRVETRRSFIVVGLATVAGAAGWRWLATRHKDDGIPWPLRRALEINEQLARDYFDPARLAPTFPRGMAKEPPLNGSLGLDEDDFDPADWQLTVTGLAETDEPVLLKLDDIKSLPRTEIVTELRCIEGWSQVVQWAGARFADFAAQYKPIGRGVYTSDGGEHADEPARYVYLATPDEEYYVGLDMASALHPQTLLCYEMNGQPLTATHGAPLRLVIPVKYGHKSIKRIGTIRFTNQRPADYWAERGYDWYVGH